MPAISCLRSDDRYPVCAGISQKLNQLFGNRIGINPPAGTFSADGIPQRLSPSRQLAVGIPARFRTRAFFLSVLFFNAISNPVYTSSYNHSFWSAAGAGNTAAAQRAVPGPQPFDSVQKQHGTGRPIRMAVCQGSAEGIVFPRSVKLAGQTPADQAKAPLLKISMFPPCANRIKVSTPASAACTAPTGLSSGSVPQETTPRILTAGCSPYRRAYAREHTITKAAPSLVRQALPL